eukprot:CAMPEP_0119107712 /NCGR_PEP_ID=MMETSP1180-20130426/11556_1 /TAXON_ID=3052 ORGANISM="Chlamydomonas cf sp, Strain CCMP681" /NCGR_SAMPLE_ID=MMETSP1180 /ASSEMBLY_ACC=CAM_ASM_000741 /LENGTH=54 /DNA_ID=CAMNT_0007093237 /DNA_START=725 /DNA_END=889 /DNA_ORIENTATION=-
MTCIPGKKSFLDSGVPMSAALAEADAAALTQPWYTAADLWLRMPMIVYICHNQS